MREAAITKVGRSGRSRLMTWISLKPSWPGIIGSTITASGAARFSAALISRAFPAPLTANPVPLRRARVRSSERGS